MMKLSSSTYPAELQRHPPACICRREPRHATSQRMEDLQKLGKAISPPSPPFPRRFLRNLHPWHPTALHRTPWQSSEPAKFPQSLPPAVPERDFTGSVRRDPGWSGRLPLHPPQWPPTTRVHRRRLPLSAATAPRTLPHGCLIREPTRAHRIAHLDYRRSNPRCRNRPVRTTPQPGLLHRHRDLRPPEYRVLERGRARKAPSTSALPTFGTAVSPQSMFSLSRTTPST